MIAIITRSLAGRAAPLAAAGSPANLPERMGEAHE